MSPIEISNFNAADEFVVEAMMQDGKFKVIGKVVGREQEHIKLELVDSKSSTVLNGIAFGQSAAARYIKSKRSFDIAFTIEENIFKKNQVQLQIEDIRPNEG